jgi:hypothetical protein
MAKYSPNFECNQWFAILESHGGKWSPTSADGEELFICSWYVKFYAIIMHIIYVLFIYSYVN